MASDCIALYGLWSYRIYIIYKYLQIIQPFVGDNFGFWDDKCILKLRDLCWHSEWSCDHDWLVLSRWCVHKMFNFIKKSHWFTHDHIALILDKSDVWLYNCLQIILVWQLIVNWLTGVDQLTWPSYHCQSTR